MLWIALHFPLLPLEAFLPLAARFEPWAVTDGACVTGCNAPAYAQGIKGGMKLSAACALVPHLRYRKHNLTAEAEALEHIAVWAGQFTPSVSLQAPCGLLLEIEGSLKLLGGINRIEAALKQGAAQMGYTLSLACAPTVAAAWLLARSGNEKRVTSKPLIASALAELPAAALDCEIQARDILSAIGAKTLADIWRLPRAELTRRCGLKLLNELDRALGKLPEARQFYSPPPYFRATLELVTGVIHAEALLFAAQRLLTQLGGYLSGRCAGVQHFQLILLHEDHPSTVLEIGLATPTREVSRLTTLVRERLASHQLVAPACRINLEAREILPLAGESIHLFDPHTSAAGDSAKLIERLRARLGPTAVQGLTVRADHRPECAWEATPLGRKSLQPPPPTRPLWLLEEPLQLDRIAERLQHNHSPLTLVAGPERIESGWWDELDIKRDYFVAQSADFSTLWVYRERRTGGWYLHGIFG